MPVLHVMILALMCLICLSRSAIAAEAILVKDKRDLKRLLNAVEPGAQLVLPKGTLKDWTITVRRSGSADAPIIIRGHEGAQTQLTGKSSIVIDKASHIEVHQIKFVDTKAPAISFSGSRHSVARDCHFEKVKAKDVVNFQGKAESNRIENCVFVNNPSVNVRVKIADLKQYPVDTIIRGNQFSDVPPIGGNGRETIQVGQTHILRGKAKPKVLVENNRFIRCNGEPEIISNKSSYNIYRGNTFIDCDGTLVMRGGAHCIIENNRFERCNNGVRLSGSHHTVRNNVIYDVKGSGIRLRYGVNDKNPAFYLTVMHCVIENNTIVDAQGEGIYIGSGKGEDLLKWPKAKKKLLGNPHRYGKRFDMDRAPYNNTIRNNIVMTRGEGDLIIHDEAPNNSVTDNWIFSSNTGVKTIREGNRFEAIPFAGFDKGDFTIGGKVGAQGDVCKPIVREESK